MTPPNAIELARIAARKAVNAAIRDEYTRRQFTVSKFDRHPDGYLHARVVVDGKHYYFHRRFGSWLAPGQIGNRAVLKEPEALLGSVIGAQVKYALSEKSSPYDTADRKEAEDARKTAGAPADTGGSDQAVLADRLPEAGDSDRDTEDVQPKRKRRRRPVRQGQRSTPVG